MRQGSRQSRPSTASPAGWRAALGRPSFLCRLPKLTPKQNRLLGVNGSRHPAQRRLLPNRTHRASRLPPSKSAGPQQAANIGRDQAPKNRPRRHLHHLRLHRSHQRHRLGPGHPGRRAVVPRSQNRKPPILDCRSYRSRRTAPSWARSRRGSGRSKRIPTTTGVTTSVPPSRRGRTRPRSRSGGSGACFAAGGRVDGRAIHMPRGSIV